MIFDVYYPFYSKNAKRMVPGIKPNPMEWAEIKDKVLSSQDTIDKVSKHRNGDPDAKVSLASICFVGRCTSTRKRSAMIPTQIIMIDIDHCINPREAWANIVDNQGMEWICKHVVVAHVTPSFGLHIFFWAQQGLETLIANMDYYNDLLHFDNYGDYDSVVHDFARISFAFPVDDLLFENACLYLNTFEKPEFEPLQNPDYEEENDSAEHQESVEADESETKKNTAKRNSSKTDIPSYSDEEKREYDEADWRGIKLKTIVAAWVKYRGEPGKQEIHNYYNEMVKYFRNIMGNNKKLILYLLPRFGHTEEECWSQIKSICKVNTLSQLDKEFYFWLKDNGFYVTNRQSKLDEFLLSDDVMDDFGDMPTPPPVIREFVAMAPKDFRIPMVNALMPIMGTLSSYVKAIYPFDSRWHTTSFFSVIYAPPSSGKGFVSRVEFLFENLVLRDIVQNAREQIYLRTINRKGANDKAPEVPHTSLRIIPAKNSEAEFLQKQQDNHGYHMFTYAAEMDAWAKGERAAGGNKSDMIRMAWDNDIYGQQFKSAATFKGKVRLYWNILITGTQNQVENYFKNVENGLVTRCCFCELENQEFQMAQMWKTIPKKGMQVIRNYMKRCDENTYEEPCEINPDDLIGINDDDFDKEVNWQFKFKERQVVDMEWIMPTIIEFQRKTLEEASLDVDKAKDAFRRRVGVRGFRLALLCTTCYPKMNKRAEETIKKFVEWWMNVDLQNMLKLWGRKYNEQTSYEVGFYNANVYNSLPEQFTKNDLLVIMKKTGLKSPLRQIIYNWTSKGYVEKISKNEFKKKKK